MVVTLCTVTAAVLVSGGPLPQPFDDRTYPNQGESRSSADIAAFNDELHRSFPSITTPGSPLDLHLFESYAALADQPWSIHGDSPIDRDVPAMFEDVISGRADRLKHALSGSDIDWLHTDALALYNKGRGAAPIAASGVVYPMRTFFCDHTGVIDERVVDYTATVIPIPLAPPR